jgi:hypothetical protein
MPPHGVIPSLLYPPVIVLLREQDNGGKEAWRWQDHISILEHCHLQLLWQDNQVWTRYSRMFPAFLMTIQSSLTFLAQGSYSS